MGQATGQRILRKKEVKLNNFFIYGSGIFVTIDSGILVDFEGCLRMEHQNIIILNLASRGKRQQVL